MDTVVGVREISAKDTTSAATILPGLEHLDGVARTDEGLILIHDLGTFLSLEEEKVLAVKGRKGFRSIYCRDRSHNARRPFSCWPR